MKASTIAKIALSAGLIWTGTIGCKASRRGIPAGGEAVTFKVKLTGPFESEPDEKKKAWIYELSGCVATVQATQIDSYDVAVFKSVGIKSNLTAPCQVKVKSLNIESFKTSFTSPEEGTFYWARKVPVKTNSYGEFYTEVSLERIYSPVEDDQDNQDNQDNTDITVNSTTEDCTAAGKVFDTETKQCKDL